MNVILPKRFGMRVFLVGVAITLIATVIAQRLHARRPIELIASLVVPHGTVIIGDSITDIATRPGTCGARTINAGFQGYTTNDYLRILPFLAPFIDGNVVIALGTNDARGGADVRAFTSAYARVLEKFRGRVLLVVEIPPSRLIPPTRLTQHNEAVHRLAAARGIPVAAIPHMETYDGMHPDAAGIEKWNRALQKICHRRSS
jgi:lysophospholipase L1-like esterase